MIPKIIHQIWLGPKPIPKWTKSWEHVPGWNYRLWTAKDLVPLPNLQKEFDACPTYYSYQSDLARLEILYKYGGLYLDCDCFNLRPIPKDFFKPDDKFVPIYESEENYPGLIANGIMAAEPHCITVKFLIHKLKNVKAPQSDIRTPWRTGPIWMTRLLNQKKYKALNLPMRIMPSIYFLPEWQKTTVMDPKPENYPNSIAFHFWGSVNPNTPEYNYQ